MKKFILVAFFLLLSSTGFASPSDFQMPEADIPKPKALVEIQTDNVVGVGYLDFSEGYDLTGREVVDAPSVPAEPAFYFRLVDGQFVRKSQAEIDAYIEAEASKPENVLARFNPDLAIGREAQVFSATDMVRFAPIGYNINELIRFKNFWGGVTEGNVPYVGLKQFCQAAIASGTGMFTQNDYDRLNGILKEQGIDLDNQG